MANLCTGRWLPVALMVGLLAGCSSYQPTKNVWKGTKSLWYTYVSPPAEIDYGEKGNLSPRALALTNSMMGIDVELTRLERTMMNADKPPTREWLTSFLTSFPWVSGFAGVKYDGTILGQEPASPLKQLDFIPLLYEDKKQNAHALRGDVQNTPLGPEVLLAVPLYDGMDFLGIVEANFDMRALMQYSQTPQDVVILTPQALLWPGKYDFAATPLAGVDWAQAVTKSTAGTCRNATGTFYYTVRFLGNLPLVFAVAESGNFPEGNGDVAQGLAFFPKDRPKLSPPPREKREERHRLAMETQPGQALPASAPAGGGETAQAAAGAAPKAAGAAGDKSGANIQPGSRDSVLLRRQKAESRSRVQERQLEGENIRVERPARRRPPAEKPLPPATGLGLDDNLKTPTLSGGRPSPFGPREQAAPPSDANAPTLPGGRPSPFGPRESAAPAPAPAAGTPSGEPSSQAAPASPAAEGQGKAEPAASQSPEPRNAAVPPAPAESAAGQGAAAGAEKPAAHPSTPATLPGGRPSPFGPRE